MRNCRYHIVYCTTCTITKKWYIGIHSTNNLDDGYLGSGKLLKYSIKKYGKKNHTREILFNCSNRDEAKQLESTMVNQHTLKLELCMNLNEGGYSNNFGNSPWNKGLDKYNTPKLSNAGRKSGSVPWNKNLTNPYSKEMLKKMVDNRKSYPKQKPKYKYNTPDGIFYKRTEVAEFYSITPQAVTHRMKSASYPQFKKERI